MRYTISFRLSMPSNNSWNGKWSGQDRFYAVTRSLSREAADRLLLKPYASWTYSFGDGWVARVEAMPVSSKEAREIRKKSAGFCGYDWMVDSILTHGEIRA